MSRATDTVRASAALERCGEMVLDRDTEMDVRSHACESSTAKVIVTSPGRNFVTLKIVTDEGVTGVGDATLNGRELAVASYLTRPRRAAADRPRRRRASRTPGSTCTRARTGGAAR